MCHMFSKHLNSCTCLNNLRIKSTKPFFEVKLSEHMSWEYAVIEKCEEEDIKEMVWRCGLDSTGSAQDWLVIFCEQVMNHQAP